MKKIIFLIFLWCCHIQIMADTRAIVEHRYDNVHIIISCPAYQEDLNKGLMIGKYISILSKSMKFQESIKIYLQLLDVAPKYTFYSPNQLFLISQARDFNLEQNLKLIEYAINQKTKNQKIDSSKFQKILERDATSTVKKVIKQKVDRPNIVSQLKSDSRLSYYYQNDQYHIYQKSDSKLIRKENNILYFSAITLTRPMIFFDKTHFYYEDLEGISHENKLLDGFELSHKFKIFEINSNQIIFDIVDTTKNKEGFAILNISQNKLTSFLE